jgi:hypothetical protein
MFETYIYILVESVIADTGGGNGPPSDKGAMTRLDSVYKASLFDHVVN